MVGVRWWVGELSQGWRPRRFGVRDSDGRGRCVEDGRVRVESRAEWEGGPWCKGDGVREVWGQDAEGIWALVGTGSREQDGSEREPWDSEGQGQIPASENPLAIPVRRRLEREGSLADSGHRRGPLQAAAMAPSKGFSGRSAASARVKGPSALLGAPEGLGVARSGTGRCPGAAPNRRAASRHSVGAHEEARTSRPTGHERLLPRRVAVASMPAPAWHLR